MEELLLVFEPGLGDGMGQILWTPCEHRKDGRGVFSTGVAITGTPDEARAREDVKRVYLYDDDGTFADPLVFDRDAGIDKLDEAFRYLSNKYAGMLPRVTMSPENIWGD